MCFLNTKRKNYEFICCKSIFRSDYFALQQAQPA
jgi:hypothetical protein